MPKVISSNDFHDNRGTHIDTLTSGQDPYMIVANEKEIDRTFVIVRPKFFAEISEKAGFENISDAIHESLKQIKEKISNRYRRIRSLA